MDRLRPVRARWLVIMVKEPRAGRVKTRLARDIGDVAAARFSRVTASNIVARLAADPRWFTVLAVAPDGATGSAAWPPDLARIPQGRGDLGARMQRIMQRMPPGPVVIVGTDIPALRPLHVARAFRLLGPHDAVLGPAADGGYWLVGLRRSPKVLAPFSQVRWSGPHALADTRANLGRASLAFTDTLIDVDDEPGYRRLQCAGARIVLPNAYRLS